MAVFACVCLPACGPKHPVDALERQAKHYDRQHAGERAAALTDDRYLVPVGDAVASVAADLAALAPVVEVSARSVGTDWSYGGSVGLDRRGEYFDQTRSRTVVSITTIGPEVAVSKSATSGQRRIGVDSKPAPWVDSSAPVDAGSLRGTLAVLETEHLAATQARVKAATVLADFETALPPGFSVSAQTASSLGAQRVVSTRKENQKRGLWATWDARTTLMVEVNPESGGIRVTETDEHKFTTEAGEGAWQPAAEFSQAAAIDWLAAALRVGMPGGHEAFGTSLVANVAPQPANLSPAPDVPRLRDMAEISIVVRSRAFRTGTGNFTVCLDHVLVNPTGSSGYDWDLPGLSDLAGATSTVAQGGGEALGELNGVADQQPHVGMMADAGVEYLTGGALDRKELEAIAKATAHVAGWMSALQVYKPDIGGTAVIAGSAFNLPQGNDTLRTDPHVCATADYTRGAPAAQVSLWDVDLTYNDAIGTCTIPLGAVAAQGLSGVPCGWARLYLSATYNFSFDQIAVVGLPPADR